MYTVQQVATEGGIAVRTVYWYVKVGVVPPPLGAGRGSRWTDEHVRARVFSGLETRLQLAWVVGGGVGIVMPLTPWFAFAVMTALLAAMVFSVIYVRRAEKRPWPTREVK